MTGRERLPLPSEENLSDEQRSAIEAVASGPRGELLACFVPLVHSPELMNRIQLVGEYLRYDSSLPAHLRELAILCVARQWDQDFEWGVHRPIAEDSGLAVETVEAIARRHRPEGAPADVLAVHDLVQELQEDRWVSDEVWCAARQHVGHGGMSELLATIGYYTLLAMVMNAALTAGAPGPRLPVVDGDR